MLSWLKRNAHTILAVTTAVGGILTVVAANSAGLLPDTVTKYLAVAGAIILNVVGVAIGGKVALRQNVKEALGRK